MRSPPQVNQPLCGVEMMTHGPAVPWRAIVLLPFLKPPGPSMTSLPGSLAASAASRRGFSFSPICSTGISISISTGVLMATTSPEGPDTCDNADSAGKAASFEDGAIGGAR